MAWRIARPLNWTFLSLSADFAVRAWLADSAASAAVRIREITLLVNSRSFAMRLSALRASSSAPAALALSAPAALVPVSRF